MKYRWLMVAGLVLAASPAHAADFAIVAPRAIAERPSIEAASVIARANAALGRTPAPRATIHIEGTLPGKGIYDQSLASLQDLPIARDLALAWKLTGKKAYLHATGRYLAAWAETYEPSFNPIDETGFDDLIMAYDIVEAKLPALTRKKVDGLLRRMATGYLERMETGNVVPPQTLTNNWQSHRVKLATLAAFQLGDQALIERAKAAYQKQVAANLRPDGSAMDFAMRDALHYVTFTLEPLTTASYAAKVHGQDWYSYKAPSGASLPRSLEWLAIFARGEKTHIEFAKSVVPFDRQRREAGVAGFQNQAWDPKEAAVLYTLASLLDSRFATVRDRLDVPASDALAAGRRDAWLLLTAAKKQ